MPDLNLNVALVQCVKSAGGSALVSAKIWPEKPPNTAQRQLLDCLNDDRPAHLTPDQVLMVMRLARARGEHLGMQYLADVLGYAPPVPIEPRDEIVELQRQFIAATEQARENAARMEELVKRMEQAGHRSAAIRAVA